MFFTVTCVFVQLMVELKRKVSRAYAQGIMLDEEAIVGMYFAVLKELHLFFGTTMLKAKPLKPKSKRKKLNLCVLPAVLQGLKSGVLLRQQDVTLDFRREYLTRKEARVVTVTVVGVQRIMQDKGGCDRATVGPLRFPLHNRIRHTIAPILERY